MKITPNSLKVNKKNITQKVCESEENVQTRVIKYIKIVYPSALYCASAGGVRTSFRQAVKMKRTGYVAGFPDLFIYEAKGGYNGLALELKTDKGQASPQQRWWRDELNRRGYKAVICRGYDAAIEAITTYMNE